MPYLRFVAGDSDLDYPSFIIEAEADGFTAVAEVWCPRPQVVHFIRQLELLDRTLSGVASLEADDAFSGRIALTLRPHGRLGRIRVDLHLARFLTEDLDNEARLAFILPEPGVLTRFRTDLARLVFGQQGEPAILSASAQGPPA